MGCMLRTTHKGWGGNKDLMHVSAWVQGGVRMSSVFSSGNKLAVSQSIAISPKCNPVRALIWVKVLTA